MIELFNKDGRVLSDIADNSVDCIITDHPYKDDKSHKAGNRNFVPYSTFNYTLDDFKEKFRVLKEGSFLVEFMPEENYSNFEYIYTVKSLALQAGFHYYSCVDWVKGSFVANQGRKSSNKEQVLIFSKGKARALRPDAKKNKRLGVDTCKMSGSSEMLPTVFNYDKTPRKRQKHAAEKPIGLLMKLISLFTLPGEVILDQFGGSMNIGMACFHTERKCIIYELDKETFDKGADYLKDVVDS